MTVGRSSAVAISGAWMDREMQVGYGWQVLLRRWRIIVVAVVVGVLATAGFLAGFGRPTFTSSAVVMVSDSSPTVNLQSGDQTANMLITLPKASVVAYQSLARDPALVREAMDKAHVSQVFPDLGVRAFMEDVTVAVIPNTTLIRIDVRLKDQEEAAAAANALADCLVERGTSISQTSMPAAQEELKASYDTSQSAVRAVDQQIAERYSKRDSVTELTTLRDTILEQMTRYQADVESLATQIQAKALELSSKQTALSHTAQYLVTTKSIADDQTLLDVATQTSGQSVLDLARLNMTSQEVNPLWQSLTTDVTSLQADITYSSSLKSLYEKTIPGLQSRVLDLNKRIDAENDAIAQLKRNKDLLTAEFNLASTNYVSSLKLQENPLPPVRVVQQAVAADEADPRGLVGKLLLAFGASLVAGVGLALAVDYVHVVRGIAASRGDHA